MKLRSLPGYTPNKSLCVFKDEAQPAARSRDGDHAAVIGRPVPAADESAEADDSASNEAKVSSGKIKRARLKRGEPCLSFPSPQLAVFKGRGAKNANVDTMAMGEEIEHGKNEEHGGDKHGERHGQEQGQKFDEGQKSNDSPLEPSLTEEGDQPAAKASGPPEAGAALPALPTTANKGSLQLATMAAGAADGTLSLAAQAHNAAASVPAPVNDAGGDCAAEVPAQQPKDILCEVDVSAS